MVILPWFKNSYVSKWFNAIGVDADKKSELIDYDNVEKLALEHKPKLIIAGGSAYSKIDFKDLEIADKVGVVSNGGHGAFLWLGRWKRLSKSVDYAHVVTSTTHSI